MPGFSSRAIRIAGLPASDILTLAPLPGNEVVAVDSSGWQLYRFSLEGMEVEPEWISLQEALPTEQPETAHGFKRYLSPLLLCTSSDGRWLAWAETLGVRGGLIDLEARRQVLALERAPCCQDVSPFPLSFVSVEGRTVLIHATASNRLDATDVESGKPLTERGPTEYVDGKEPPHYLNYFHSSLSVSPGGSWLVTNGWVWHPWGCIVVWRTDAWLGPGGNAWESEDGPTKFDIYETGAEYFWDRPLCWVDDDTLAFWGRGDDDTELENAVGIYSLPERKLLCWIDGPQAREGLLAHDDGVLIAISPRLGVSVWDIQTGTKLAEDATLRPRLWHPDLRVLLSTTGGDNHRDFVLTRFRR
jgi:hypothetical protein